MMDEKAAGKAGAALQVRPKDLILLNVLFLLYSFVSVCQKYASQHGWGDYVKYLFLAGAVVLLAVYAVMWQQVLKRVPLSVAYSNKGVTLLWLLLWGFVFFQEVPKWNNFVGIALAFIGIVLIVWKGKGGKEGEAHV